MKIDLNLLDPEERKETILEWQCNNIWDFNNEQSPLGYIYAFQEPAFLTKYGKMANWAKNQTIHYDRLSTRPRAGIICSPNMDCWLQKNYTDDDVCTVSWNSGTEHGEIFIISYSIEKRASRASALRAGEASCIRGLVLTQLISPTHWTRPERPHS